MDRRSLLQTIVLLWLVGLTIWHFDLSDKQDQLWTQMITFEYDIIDKYQTLQSNLDTINNQLSNKINRLETDMNSLDEEIGSLSDRIAVMNRTVSNILEQVDLLKLVVSKDVTDTFRPFSQVNVKEVVGENGELISADNVGDILKSHHSHGLEVYVIPYDEDYVAYDSNIYKKVMYKTYLLLENRPYYSEFSDCDDFAEVALAALKYNLPGSACFLTLIEYDDVSHAMVSCVSKNGEVLYFEPQTGEFFSRVPQETEVVSVYYLG